MAPRPIDEIADTLRKAIVGAIADAKDELVSVADDAAQTNATALEQGLWGGGFSLHDLLLAIPGVGELLTVEEGVFGHLLGKLGKFVAAVGSGWALGEFFAEALRPVWLEITHSINDAIQSEIFDPNTAASLDSKGIITHAFGRSEAAGGNLAGDHYDKLVTAQEQRPDVQTLMTLLNLDQLHDADVTDALRHHGYPERWAQPLFALRRLLLSPADLALANLRGNIDDAVLEGYAKQLGITPDDMQVLIENTGEPPGPEQLMEALRRGFIDDARFERGIRQSRVRNEWIDVERALRHSPMSTAEAVRAVVEHYLTDDEGKAIAEQNGLEPEHWTPLRESFGRPLSHEQMMTLFHRGEVTLDDVRQAFRESDLKDKYIDQAIELARRLIPERTIVSMIHHGVITHDDGLGMLKRQGFNDSDAEALIKLGAAENLSAHKQLSRTDVVTMYEDGLMPKRDALDRLIKLGYPQQDATAALDLADFKANAATQRTLQRGIEASLKAHHVTPAQAISQLERGGIDHTQAQRLVDTWLQQRGTRVLELSYAEIASAADYGIITFDQAVAGIRDLGWSENDAKIIVGVRLKGLPHGVTVSPPAGN